MIFKFHFALWCGGLIGVSSYELYQYEKQYFDANLRDHNLIFTISPFILMFFKPLISLLADHYRAHHHCLLLALIVTLLGYGSLAILPHVPNLLNNHKQLAWILFSVGTFIGQTSMGVVNSLADSLAVHAADKSDNHYSKYRLWGPIGFGIFGAMWSLADKLPVIPRYTPGILLLVLLHSLNIVFLARNYNSEELRLPHWHLRHQHYSSGDNNDDQNNCDRIQTDSINPNGHEKTRKIRSNNIELIERIEQRVEMDLSTRIRYLRLLIRQEKSIYLYTAAFMFCGILTGFQFHFILRTLNDLAQTHKLPNVGTFVALVIIVQSVGGELIFFLFAEPIIKRLGTVNTLALSFASYAARHLIYSFWIPTTNSIYFILIIELLQGPAYGLMYCVLTHKAHDYSARVDKIINLEHDPNNGNKWHKKNLLHATLQGIIGGSHDGLGLGLGILIGGKLYDINPQMMWLIAGTSAASLAILTLLIRAVRCIYCVCKRPKVAQSPLGTPQTIML